MKLIPFILPGIFMLFLAGCAPIANSCCGGGTYGCCQPAPVYPSCQCVDPACRGSNYCLDTAQCCRVFGNIAARAQ